jgi:hypothetical protein
MLGACVGAVARSKLGNILFPLLGFPKIWSQQLVNSELIGRVKRRKHFLDGILGLILLASGCVLGKTQLKTCFERYYR